MPEKALTRLLWYATTDTYYFTSAYWWRVPILLSILQDDYKPDWMYVGWAVANIFSTWARMMFTSFMAQGSTMAIMNSPKVSVFDALKPRFIVQYIFHDIASYGILSIVGDDFWKQVLVYVLLSIITTSMHQACTEQLLGSKGRVDFLTSASVATCKVMSMLAAIWTIKKAAEHASDWGTTNQPYTGIEILTELALWAIMGIIWLPSASAQLILLCVESGRDWKALRIEYLRYAAYMGLTCFWAFYNTPENTDGYYRPPY